MVIDRDPKRKNCLLTHEHEFLRLFEFYTVKWEDCNLRLSYLAQLEHSRRGQERMILSRNDLTAPDGSHPEYFAIRFLLQKSNNIGSCSPHSLPDTLDTFFLPVQILTENRSSISKVAQNETRTVNAVDIVPDSSGADESFVVVCGCYAAYWEAVSFVAVWHGDCVFEDPVEVGDVYALL